MHPFERRCTLPSTGPIRGASAIRGCESASTAMAATCTTHEASYELQWMRGKGRGAVAVRDILAGEHVLVEEPVATAVHHAAKADTCATCLRRMDEDVQAWSCEACGGLARFCSSKCMQEAVDGTAHAPAVCALLQAAERRGADVQTKDRVRAIAGVWTLKGSHPQAYQKFMGLCGSADDVEEPNGIVDVFAHLLQPQTEPEYQAMTHEVLEWVAKEEKNSMGVMDVQHLQERRVRGSAIYPDAALFNHSCLPNLARVDHFDGPTHLGMQMAYVALHDIPRGEELELSYTPLEWGLLDRQEYLWEGYKFACGCNRCQVESTWGMEEDAEHEDVSHQITEDSDMDAYVRMFILKYVCTNGECGGTLIPLPGGQVSRCNICGIQRSEEQFLASLEAEEEDEVEESEEYSEEEVEEGME
mmetsp:Transcript_3729/g.23405  ORF Transcript_3729/g.23405 Transcript_3729/m.23405 type:complete len:416 (-) Transcript_3729:4370-5617(-)